jgi:hypothetical protein
MLKARTYFFAFAVGAFVGVIADKARAETAPAPISDFQQYAMVLTATELLENVNCHTPEKFETYDRLVKNGIEVRGRDNAIFRATVEGVAQIYLTDPKGFCARAGR